jgi:hypothetical protein
MSRFLRLVKIVFQIPNQRGGSYVALRFRRGSSGYCGRPVILGTAATITASTPVIARALFSATVFAGTLNRRLIQRTAPDRFLVGNRIDVFAMLFEEVGDIQERVAFQP